MKPELGYGARAAGHPGEFEAGVRLWDSRGQTAVVREAHARADCRGHLDKAIAKAKATPNLKDYTVSASSIQAAAGSINEDLASLVMVRVLSITPKKSHRFSWFRDPNTPSSPQRVL